MLFPPNITNSSCEDHKYLHQPFWLRSFPYDVIFMCSTYNVEVGWICSAWVSPDPGRTTGLHVNDGGAQAVDVCLGAVSSTQNQLWTHIHLKERRGMFNG